MGFKNLENLKEILPKESAREKLNNTYKGNVKYPIHATHHCLERFLERKMNGTNYSLDTIKEYVETLILDKGIQGYYNQKKQEGYVAVPNVGLFIIDQGYVAKTFIGIENLSYKNRELFIGLLNKGRVK